jgi:hypothetical protein
MARSAEREFVGRLERRAADAADDSRAISADQRVIDGAAATRAVEGGGLLATLVGFGWVRGVRLGWVRLVHLLSSVAAQHRGDNEGTRGGDKWAHTAEMAVAELQLQGMGSKVG